METPKVVVIDGSKVQGPTVKEEIEEIREMLRQYEEGLITGKELSTGLVDHAVKLGFSVELEKTDWEKEVEKRMNDPKACGCPRQWHDKTNLKNHLNM